MQFLSKKVLTSAVLALVFSVAVSGGCGGGGGGHYSGDFGNSGDSSQEITTENVSPDVSPVPAPIPESYDIPVSVDEYGDDDDEYGVNGDETTTFTDLYMLNNVEWDIESIKIVDTQGYEMPVYQNSFKINGIQNITLNKLNIFFSVERLLWSDGIGNPSYTLDLTTDFRPLSSSTGSVSFSTQAAPILRSASKFTEINSNVANSTTKDYRAEIRVNRNRKSVLIGRETIRIAKKFPTYVIIENQFAINNAVYTSYLTLKASKNNSPDSLFKSINNNNWRVKSIDVAGMVKDRKGNTIMDAPVNYPVNIVDFGKITVLTSDDNNVKVLNFMDKNGQPIQNSLTATFHDRRRYEPNLVAPILRPASGFQPKGKNNGYEVFEATLSLQDQPFPNNEILYITEYGPKGNIVLNNSFYIPNAENPNQYYFYWSTLYLEPYNLVFHDLLNNTEWVIRSVSVSTNGVQCTIENNSYNYNVDKLRLEVFDVFNSASFRFYDGKGNLRADWDSPLTIKIKIKAPENQEDTLEVPIFRSAKGFENTRTTQGYDFWGVNIRNEQETLDISTSNIPSTYIIVNNKFYDNDVEYNTQVELEHYEGN